MAELLAGAPTAYVDGVRRTRRPADTLADLEPRLGTIGITRVADVTGLDRIGIPVVMVVRPNSRSLSVSQGKGVDLVAAKVSGIMESVELHHAEHTTGPVAMASWEQLRDGGAVVDPRRLPRSRDSVWSPDHVLPWTPGVDLLTGDAVHVPFELVHANATYPLVPGSGCFVRSTNGLASGNTAAEAVLHAMCEVIERDALALWDHAPPERRRATRIALDTVTDPVNRALLDRYEDAGVAVMAWAITTDVGVAAFRVIIFDRSSDPLLAPIPAAFGAGCHLDRSVALARALTEAAQSRLTAIAGSRDDLTRARYHRFQAASALDGHRRVADEEGSVDVEQVPSVRHDDVAEDVSWVLDRLRAAGVSSVAAVDLGSPAWPVSVVRVVIADLEGPTESPAYRPGPRVSAMLGGSR